MPEFPSLQAAAHSLRLSFLSAGCNRIPGCLDAEPGTGLVAYGSESAVIVALAPPGPAITALKAHTARVNCVRWLPSAPGSVNGDMTATLQLASASSDGSVVVWARKKLDQNALDSSSSGWQWAPISVLPDQGGHLTHLATSSQSSGKTARMLAVVSSNSSVFVWEEGTANAGSGGGGNAVGGQGCAGAWAVVHRLNQPLGKIPLCVALNGFTSSAESGGVMLAVGLADSSCLVSHRTTLSQRHTF